jgi:hypothetical protein
MRRNPIAFASVIAAAFLVGACSAPKTPAQPTAETSPGFGLIVAQGPTATPSLAECLAGSGAASCFSAGGRSRTSAIAGQATALGPPVNLTASSSGGSVTLTWTASSGADAATVYIIQAGARAGLSDLANFSTGSSATLFQASGVGAGVYYVRVLASGVLGTSAASNEAILVVGGSPGAAPGAPSGLVNTLNAGGVVGFSWTAASGSPTSYVIEAGSRPGLADLANSDLGSAATTMTATGVGGGTYYVRVRAKNASGISVPSNEVVLIVGGAGCRPNLEPTVMNVTGVWSGTVAVGPSKGLAVTFVFQRLAGSDVFFDAPYSDTSGRTGGGGLTVASSTFHPQVQLYFNPFGTSPVTGGAFFLGEVSACAGNTVLEFTGEVHLGYLGSRACQPGETCPFGGVHLIGPGYPMTLTRR